MTNRSNLIREQIPIWGRCRLRRATASTLIRGKAKKLTITAALEEGFAGEVSFTFAGLPEGVQELSAVEAGNDAAPTEVTENCETVAPKT